MLPNGIFFDLKIKKYVKEGVMAIGTAVQNLKPTFTILLITQWAGS